MAEDPSREDLIQLVAMTFCAVVGFAPIEPSDGNSNWWMFRGEAEKIVDDLLRRFPRRG